MIIGYGPGVALSEARSFDTDQCTSGQLSSMAATLRHLLKSRALDPTAGAWVQCYELEAESSRRTGLKGTMYPPEVRTAKDRRAEQLQNELMQGGRMRFVSETDVGRALQDLAQW